MPAEILSYLLIILVYAFLCGALFKKLGQPPVIGYITAGFLLGILLKNPNSHESVEFLAELGIVLMLFTLGIEFSFKRLSRVMKTVISGGLIQLAVTTIVGTFVLTLFNFDTYPAFFMAAAFSLSSTAIVAKILSDRAELDTLPGEILVGWLIIQDLTVLPLLVLLPTIAQLFSHSISLEATLFLLGKNILLIGFLLGAVFVLSKRVMPPVMQAIGSFNSRELLLIAMFTFAGISAFFAQSIGLSAALGAFLAGLLISESSEHHAVFTEIRPIRDIFALLFFATLGLVLPNNFILSHLGTIVVLTLVFMTIKFLVVLILVSILGHHAKTSFLVSVGLIEIGEFAFVLAKLGFDQNLIDSEIYGMILSVTLLSILIMPPLYLAAPNLYTKLREYSRKRWPRLYVVFFRGHEHKDTLEELPFSDHVVICGSGRVGKYIARALSFVQIPFIVIEYNQERVHVIKEMGQTVIYGDPSDIDILDLAQVDKARLVIITIPDVHTQQMIIAASKKLNKKIHLMCRTHFESEQQLLKDLGVESVVHPEFEAALTMVGKVLGDFGEKKEVIRGKLARLKIEHGMI